MFRTSQVFVTKTFARWMRKSQVTDLDILGATEEMVQGLIDANLGGYLVKKRVALQGRGKSAGARTIVATKFEQRWIFLFGFEKNELRRPLSGSALLLRCKLWATQRCQISLQKWCLLALARFASCEKS